MELTEYYSSPRISQSYLKLLTLNPRVMKTVKNTELYFEEKEHFTIGSAVDCLLTQSEEDFKRLYYVSMLETKPSDTVKSIINEVFDKVRTSPEHLFTNESFIQDYYNTIIECCNNHSYQSTWKDNTRFAKICEFWEYWNELKYSIGKQILSQDEQNLITAIVDSLKGNFATKKYFDTEKYEIINQLAVYFDFEGVPCKALLDRICIDHVAKTIQPLDIKTMGDYTLNFPKSLRKRRYDIQAAWYTEALSHYCVENKLDYPILPFKFIVESTIDVGCPLVFTCTETLLQIGKYGKNTPDSESQSLLGFTQLIDLHKYYLKNGFDVDKKVKENNSELMVDWSGL